MTDNLTIKEVTKNDDWFSISTKEGTCFGMKTKYNVIPKAGDKITLHCVRGSTIRGMDLNGKKIYYKTDEELDQEHKEYCEKAKKDREERFIKEKPQLDKKYKALPKCFQERIDRFRTNNPDFRKEYESYEMFCCEQAVEISKSLSDVKKIASRKGFKGWLKYDLQKRFNAFRDLDWKDQKVMSKNWTMGTAEIPLVLPALWLIGI